MAGILADYLREALATAEDQAWFWTEEWQAADYAKKHPGELKYPSVGYGSSTHLAMEMFNHATGTKMVHVPMKSDPEMLASILGGHCQVSMMYEVGLQAMQEGGRIRLLATAGQQRLSWLPDMPTFSEKGYPGVVYFVWYGVAGPKDMPKEVSDKLRDAFDKTFQDMEFHNMIKKFGVTPTYMPGDQFKKFIHSEAKRLRSLMIESGLKVIEE
jgi:tripartite-type tricarboxylate transporter receptor subunit TctC